MHIVISDGTNDIPNFHQTIYVQLYMKTLLKQNRKENFNYFQRFTTTTILRGIS